MPRAFLTGGTGFLGSHLAELLVSEGWEVTAFHRPGADTAFLASLGATLTPGQLTDPASVLAAMPEGVDGVFHVAASTRFWKLAEAEQTAVNVGGTASVVEAALARGAGRFVLTSSISAYGDAPYIGQRIHEDTPSNAAGHRLNYLRTKWASQQLVLDAMARGLDPVVLQPANILGPRDLQGWSSMFRMVAHRQLPAVPPGSSAWCHVHEVARAHLTAYHKAPAGRCFVLGGVDADFASVVRETAQRCGVKPPPTAPPIVLKVLGHLSEWASHITRKEPDLTPGKVFLACAHGGVDNSRAIDELGYTPAPMDRMIDDTLDWLRSEGHIP